MLKIACLPGMRRLPRKLAVALVAAAAVCCVPLAVNAAAVVVPRALAGTVPVRSAGMITPMTVVAPRELTGTAAPDAPAGTAADPIPARTLAATSPACGLCSVPGIGDIGGLFGFCSIGQSGITGQLNNLCQPGVPQPESATSGIDSLIRPPAAPGKPIATPYNQYGMAGQYWAATNLQCSDMTSLIGNDVAGMIFDFAKALDRVTITVYQSAAGEGILSWLQDVTDHLITGLGNAIYFPYVALIVILGAIWLAWQGLIRKRATRSIEGTIWMVVACAAAIWLIGLADFTGLGKGVSDGISTTLNAAFAHLPSPGQASCLPVVNGDPQISPASFSYTSGRTVVDQNANELWTVLVCKPWLDGEFGTTVFATAHGAAGQGAAQQAAAQHAAAKTAVNLYARPLLWAQAIAVNERPTTGLIQAKQAAYVGIAQTISSKDPSAYPLFQGKEWTTRLEIAFASLLAAVVAGVLILLISVTLILLKLGFLLLLIVGPFFLLIGTHPGFGRVVAVRWFEMLVGVLLKQAAVALALSVLLYSYALIMGTSDAVLPWALKILMITLVTVAVFIYRKPFQHLFASVGYSAIGATDRADADLSRAAATARANTRAAATLAVPGFAGYRVARWARRNPAQAAGLALSASTAVSTAGLAAGAAAAGAGGADGAQGAGETVGAGAAGAAGADPAGAGAGAQAGAASRARAYGASAGTATGDQAPPLRLPASNGAPSTWVSSGAGSGAGPGNGAGARSGVSASSGAGSVPASSGGSAGSAPPVSSAASSQRWPGGAGNGWSGGAAGAASPPTSRRPGASGGPQRPPAPGNGSGSGSASRPGSGPGPSSWVGPGERASASRPASQPTGTSRSRSSAPPRSGGTPRSSAPSRPAPSRSAGSGSSGSGSGSSGSGSGSGSGSAGSRSSGSRSAGPSRSSAPARTPGLFRSLGSRRQPPAAPPRRSPGGGTSDWTSGEQLTGGQAGGLADGEERSSGPFWLRPLKRQK